jgi:hypothetical protein
MTHEYIASRNGSVLDSATLIKDRKCSFVSGGNGNSTGGNGGNGGNGTVPPIPTAVPTGDASRYIFGGAVAAISGLVAFALTL